MPRITHVAIATVVLLTTTGGAFLATTPQPASAQLSGLSVSDTSATLGPNNELTGVDLQTQVDYQFDSSHPLSKAEVILYVAPLGGSFEALDTVTLTEPGQNGSATVDLGGDVTDLSALSTDTFDAVKGTTTATDLELKVVFKGYRNGTRVVAADASDTATVSVAREELSVSASVAGEGTLTVLTG